MRSLTLERVHQFLRASLQYNFLSRLYKYLMHDTRVKNYATNIKLLKRYKIKCYLVVDRRTHNSGNFNVATLIAGSTAYLSATWFWYFVYVVGISGDGQTNWKRGILATVLATGPIRRSSGSAAFETGLNRVYDLRTTFYLAILLL